MKFICCIFFILILPVTSFAQEYDSFLLSYQQVRVEDGVLRLELVLEQPKEHKISAALKNGAILKLTVETQVFEKKFFRNKALTAGTLTYYLRYDPLTKQFNAMQEAKTIARNLDAEFLLNILIQHISIDIPYPFEANTDYLLKTKIDLVQSNAKNWLGQNMIFGPDKIIQPLEFDYEFSTEK